MTLRPQKVTATILFTDLVSSTEFVERAGDDRAERVISTHRRILAEVAEAHGGDVVKTMGDGLMVAFRSATDALSAALEMQEAARNPVAGVSLQLQAGLNSGDLVVDGEDYFGLHVVIAERLCKLAEPGQVLCSGVVVGLLAGQTDFEFRDLGPAPLKGVNTPISLYEVGPRRRSAAERLARMPLIGRSGEAQRIELRLDQALRGAGSVVLLTGEPGIGKTRAAEETESLARHAGAATAWARCYDGEGQGRAPIASLVESLCREDEAAALSRLSEEDVGELRRLVPGLPAVGAQGEEREQSPGVALARLAEATGRLVAEVSAERAVVVLFDDLQWASTETAAVFRQLARMAPRHRVLVIGTCRDAEVDSSRPIAEALSVLARESDSEIIHLEGLAVDEVTAFVRAVADDAPAAFGEALARHTGGNPYFIREVLLDLAAQGGDEGISAKLMEKLAVTAGMRQVTLRRVAQLSEPARQLLTAASAFESEFLLDVIQRAAGLEEDAALDAIDESLRAQLIRPGDGLDTYVFTHWIIGRALRETLSPSRVARLHRDIARCLGEAGGEVRRVAYHLRSAGSSADPASVAQTCLEAGREAAHSLSYEEAIANLEAAAKAAETVKSAEQRADALHELGRAQGELGRWQEALANFDVSQQLYREAGRTAKLAEGLYYRARLLSFHMRLQEAGEALTEAREVLLAAEDIDETERKRILARVLEQLAQLAMQIGRYNDADELESEAMALSEEVGIPSLVAETVFARGWIRLQRLEVNHAIEDFNRYRELARAGNYPLQDLVGAIRGGIALLWSGDAVRATEWLGPAQEQCDRTGRGRDGAYACIGLAAAAALSGELDEAGAQAERGLTLGDLADPLIPNGLMPIHAYAAALRGDYERALAAIEPLLTPEERIGRPRSIVSGFGYQALLRALSGDVGTSRLMALAMAERFSPRTPDLRSVTTYTALGELALLLRERELAALVAEQLEELPGQGLMVSPGWPVLIPRLIGGLAALRGEVELGRARLTEALTIARNAGTIVEEALTELELARVDRAGADAHLARAAEIAETLGLRGLRDRSKLALLESVG